MKTLHCGFDFLEAFREYCIRVKLEQDIKLQEGLHSFELNGKQIKIYNASDYKNTLNIKDDIDDYDGFLVISETKHQGLGFSVKCYSRDDVKYNKNNKIHRYYLDLHDTEFRSIRKLCGLFEMWY